MGTVAFPFTLSFIAPAEFPLGVPELKRSAEERSPMVGASGDSPLRLVEEDCGAPDGKL